ncbi:fasciclin domain-containing protein [Chitinophaga nivalis]|uniref:Fasciclin domain-containing protein n=1 Tax=Chitinophaga nivalis TaxID=2991709 RepID=A0ABT3IKF8_9BACT|nr:fasciclin domain-containing protein [Chitinophaga nivalis]MCW3465901.1 fasciclin domain-containing protein [Chitinophaga nivalis]MCW3484408.1 fasciclin domain-containing protein [Chitinophaga nivalis]
MSNVVEVVVADRNLATMSRSIKAAGLDMVLSKKGPFTIFAPTDLAFGKLQPGRIPALLQSENKEKLIELLNHHVVEGLTSFNDLKDNQKLVTANGRELAVKVNAGKVTINGATVQGRDNRGTNGVVHSLDTVIEMK